MIPAAFREGIRLEAGERFVASEKTAVIAKDLRVSVRSVERWRRAWREGGTPWPAARSACHRPGTTDGGKDPRIRRSVSSDGLR